MKRIIAFFTALVCVFSLFCFTANAEKDETLDKMFTDQLEFLDGCFSNNLADYAVYKMTRLLVNKAWDDFSDTEIPADLFEETLDKYFVLDDTTFTKVREYAHYNATERTYTLAPIGGFGGGTPQRQYTGFKQENGIYEVFYNTIIREYMRDAFDSVPEYYEYISDKGYPPTITYNGKTYTQGDYGEYEIIHGLENTGKKYTVDIKDGIVRVYSISTFTEKEHPDYAPPLDEVFDGELWLLNGYYSFGTEFMAFKVQKELFTSDDTSAPVIVSAEKYESVLNKYFVVTDEVLQNIRTFDTDILKYDAESQTYAIYYSGGFGGSLRPRAYKCYGKNSDGTYDVFYQNINYDFLDEEGMNAAEEADWPEFFTYNGVEYQNGPDGYYRIASYDNEGYMYRVSINSDWTVRIIEVGEFVENDLPGYKLGDIDADYGRSANDAIYLLYNVFFGDEDYPLYQNCDFDKDNNVTANDAIYLLYNIFFGDDEYPIAPKTDDDNEWTGNY